MFFGTARVLLRNGPKQSRSPLTGARSVLQTAYGPMNRGAVYGQVLIVPAAVAFFGVAIAVIRAIVM